MKKIILTIAIVFGISQFVTAQMNVGVGLMEASNSYGSLALEAKADFGITETISVSPSVDFFFPTSALVNDVYLGSDNSPNLLLTISVDGHYHFDIIEEKLKVYPLAGVNLLVSSVDDNNWYWSYYDFGPRLFVNAGGGATFAFSESMKAYLEVKFTRFGPAASAGVYFTLGN
jgi:hypothetical protein